MKILKVLHLASFNGNIGDNANHFGFYKYLNRIDGYKFSFDELEIREFYWKKKFFNSDFVDLSNGYDLIVIGGGNYFELWVESSPTGTSIAIELELLEQINTPILFNALGVDPGQGVSDKNINKFKKFLDLLIKRNDYISIRNDGAQKAILEYVGEEYLSNIYHTPDAGFFLEVDETNNYFKNKKYIAINVATDMDDIRFSELSYSEVLETFKNFIFEFIKVYHDYEVVLVPHIFRDMTFNSDLMNMLDDELRSTKVSIAPLLHGKESLSETMSIYRNAKFILANRFHANVCGIGLGVPTIGLVNYRQIEELYNEIKSNNFVDIRFKEFDKALLEKIKNFEENKRLLGDITREYERNIYNIEVWLKERF